MTEGNKVAKKILIVDDENDPREYLKVLFEAISDEDLTRRRARMEALPPGEAWQPTGERTRVVTRALKP